MKSIYIDVKDFDTEKKKRVQDAFFKMGNKWIFSDSDYAYLEKSMYTNTDIDGYVQPCIMWVTEENIKKYQGKLTTYNELMEMAGMQEHIEKDEKVSPPKMKTSYEKVEEEIFDLKEDFEQGNLYQKAQHQRDYSLIKTTETLAQMLNNGCCYRKIKKKAEWWEDIPEGGVLCSTSEGYLVTIVDYEDSDKNYPFKDQDEGGWNGLTPLTKEEVMKFYLNAEKIEKYL